MFYKLKLLNRKNLYYVIFKYLYNFTRLEYFYSLHVIFFEKNKKIIKFQKSFFKKIKTLNYDGSKLSNLKVLELGGGSLFGLFPLFLKYKCKSFTNIDPFIEKNPAKINILKKVFKNRVKNFLKINDLDFNKYNQIKKFRKKKYNEKFEVIVSMSCLEHINDIEKNFKKLKYLTDKKHLQYHVINFSSHINKKNPFKNLYSEHPKNFRKKYKNNINFLRMSDYEKILKKNRYFYKFKTLSSYKIKKSEIHTYWKKYTINELKVRTALLKISGRY